MTIWKPIPNWPKYECSDGGNVRGRNKKVLRKARGGRANNYYRVMLTEVRNGTRHRRHAYVHHLVLETFVGPRPVKRRVACHRNDNGTDNRLANLYWGTPEDNECDRYINSLPLDDMEDAPF